jgi:flagellin
LRLTSDAEFTVAQAGTSTLGYLASGTAARSAISSIDLTGDDLTGSIKAKQAIETIDSALNQVATIRSTIAAYTRVFEHAINVNSAVGASKSVGLAALEDADFAAETARLAKAMMLRSASTAMLAQANANEEMVLTLLRQFHV